MGTNVMILIFGTTVSICGVIITVVVLNYYKGDS